MKKTTLRNIAMLYFGFALSAFGNINFDNWRFYAISIPVIILLAMSEDIQK